MTRRRWPSVLTAVLLIVPVLAVIGGGVAGADDALAPDREVHPFGDARDLGSLGSVALAQPIVDAAATPSGLGYWLVASDGGVFAFGDARFLGSTGAIRLNQPIVAAASTPTGQGYWLVASDGGVFAFGDAPFFGSTGAIRLNQPIVAAASTPTGQGYWLVASDGGVFAFGDARFLGSTGALRLNQPITAALATPTGAGYRLIASDGGVFAFGDAGFLGSTGGSAPASPIVAAAGTPTGLGYWLATAEGGVFPFGDAPALGTARGRGLDAPVTAMAATPTGAGFWLVTRGGCALVGAVPPPSTQQTTREAGDNLLVDVDVDLHRCVHRVTFTFRPAGTPIPPGPLGWRVGYEPGPPTNIAGDPVPVDGAAVLMVRVFPARTFDIEADPIVDTYPGPNEIRPPSGPIREVQFVSDFEALMEWAIGVDVARPVRIVELTDPPRLLVDIATS